MLNGLGLIALIALAFGLVERHVRASTLRAAIQGGIFGAGAVIAMAAATAIPGGFIIDARAVILGLGAAFCGWVGVVPALAFAAAYRLWLGGSGSSVGIATMAFAVVVGLAWGWRYRDGRAGTVRSLALLSLAVSAHAVLFVFLPVPDPLAIIGPALLLIVPAYMAGTVVMGSLMQRERRMIERERSLEVHAMTDSLTGLANRRAYQLILDEELRLLRKAGSDRNSDKPRPGVAVLVIDIDLFKRVNDTHGHDAGDHVLKAVAQSLRAALSPCDYLCRHGGEEFCAVLPGSDLARAMSAAERLRGSVARQTFESPRFHPPGSAVRVSVSIGVAVAPDHGEHAAELYVRADRALYRAKAEGRNRIVAAPFATVPRPAVPAEQAPRDGAGPVIAAINAGVMATRPAPGSAIGAA